MPDEPVRFIARDPPDAVPLAAEAQLAAVVRNEHRSCLSTPRSGGRHVRLQDGGRRDRVVTEEPVRRLEGSLGSCRLRKALVRRLGKLLRDAHEPRRSRRSPNSADWTSPRMFMARVDHTEAMATRPAPPRSMDNARSQQLTRPAPPLPMRVPRAERRPEVEGRAAPSRSVARAARRAMDRAAAGRPDPAARERAP